MLEYIALYRKMDEKEYNHIYFRGHTDSLTYLKKQVCFEFRRICISLKISAYGYNDYVQIILVYLHIMSYNYMQIGGLLMRRFDYSFLNNGLLPAKLMNITASIASLKTMASVRKEKHIRVFTELEAIAKVQSVKSSNAIEGIVTSDERIAEIVNQNSAPLNHNEAEIAGYRDALNEIHLGYEHINRSGKGSKEAGIPENTFSRKFARQIPEISP